MRTFTFNSIDELLSLIEKDQTIVKSAFDQDNCIVTIFADDVEIIFPNIRFAKLNKLETLKEYKKELELGKYNRCDVVLDRLIICNLTQFHDLTSNFMSNNELWANVGGSTLRNEFKVTEFKKNEFKTIKFNWDLPSYSWSDEQLNYYRNHSLTICCLLLANTGDSSHYAYIDTEGYNYARYVGL